MEVIVRRGKLGQSVYHIWDNDRRTLACHKVDVVELIRKLQKALREDR